MFNSLNGELARHLQADLIAKAQYEGLVREALSVRNSWPRHVVAVALLAAAHRMEPVGISFGREAASVRPELPCAISPC
ncbi:MAG: hypothetical protein QOI26_1735 [Pseudonocardiales bacterium]|jgi:hypothetical protein|nr:hypothetical protein [Pseudonocardiales bacterium]